MEYKLADGFRSMHLGRAGYLFLVPSKLFDDFASLPPEATKFLLMTLKLAAIEAPPHLQHTATMLFGDTPKGEC